MLMYFSVSLCMLHIDRLVTILFRMLLNIIQYLYYNQILHAREALSERCLKRLEQDSNI